MVPNDATTFADRLVDIQARIRQATSRVGRDPAAIRMIAATKGVSVERIKSAIDAGIREFGENRLQETLPKIAALEQAGAVWHFIGRLQRRKVREVVGRFVLIHSVDTIDLAREIDKRAEAAGLVQPVLIEVNVAGEASKAGFAAAEVQAALTACDAMAHIEVRGLMAIPPLSESPESARPYCRTLRELAASASQQRFRRVRMHDLSMGMSEDFEIAIEEGATIVRIGTALFGPRNER